MGIEQICNTINNLFKNERPPFPPLNTLMLVFAMQKKPGLSTIQSVANITKDLNKLGIPTGSMPDGSPNLTIGMLFGVTKEHYRALKNDASIQVGIQPGTLMVQAGVFPGTNTTAGLGRAKIN